MVATAPEHKKELSESLGVSGVVIGTIEGVAKDGHPLVTWPNGGGSVVAARTVWMASPPNWLDCEGLRVVLGFANGEESRPILLGLLDAPPTKTRVSEVTKEESESLHTLRPKVLRIESEQELVLECGEAKIALRADGRVVILGGYLLSRSKGVNKIKGGSVQIN